MWFFLQYVAGVLQNRGSSYRQAIQISFFFLNGIVVHNEQLWSEVGCGLCPLGSRPSYSGFVLFHITCTYAFESVWNVQV